MPGAASPSPSPFSRPGGRPHPRRCVAPIPGGARRPASSYLREHDNFGSVRICRAKSSGLAGEEFARKALPKNGEETVHREVEIMQHHSGHPGVVILKSVFEDADKFYLVMELCSSGRLLDVIAREGCFSEHRAAVVIKDLMSVVKYCHEMGVIHRDIKP